MSQDTGRAIWRGFAPGCCRFDELQGEIREWSNRNFPRNTPADPWEGIIEEVGELASATLAILNANTDLDRVQEFQADRKDAIADSIIYLFDYCNRREFGVHSILWHDAGLGCKDFRGLQEAAGMGRECSFLQLRLMSALGKVAHSRLKLRQGIRVNEDHIGNERRAIGEILSLLALTCNRYHYDMQEIVDETWAKVRQRDWTKNKANGQADTIVGLAVETFATRPTLDRSDRITPEFVNRLNTLIDDDQPEPYTATVPTRKTMPYED